MTNFEDFRQYCAGLTKQVLFTAGQSRPFTVKVSGAGLTFVPATGQPRKANPGRTEKVLGMLSTTGDWSPARYRDVTYHASYILAVAKHQAMQVKAGTLDSPTQLRQRTPHTNDYCELWTRSGWKKVSVATALERSVPIVRCIECHGAVRLHVTGPRGVPRAHAEHLERHEGCSLGHYFSGKRSMHPHPLSSPAADSEVSIASAIRIEDDESSFPEGRESFRLHRRLERDGSLPKRVKADRLAATGALACDVCAFDFAKAFGQLGDGFIEAHHRVPVHALGGKEKTKAKDLALVCSNCHRMLHRSDPQLSIEELRELLRPVAPS